MRGAGWRRDARWLHFPGAANSSFRGISSFREFRESIRNMILAPGLYYSHSFGSICLPSGWERCALAVPPCLPVAYLRKCSLRKMPGLLASSLRAILCPPSARYFRVISCTDVRAVWLSMWGRGTDGLRLCRVWMMDSRAYPLCAGFKTRRQAYVSPQVFSGYIVVLVR